METRLCENCLKLMEGNMCSHCGYPEQDSVRPHQLRPGTVLGGRYRLGKVLGQGGFGITYLAWDLHDEMKVAVKEFFPSAMVSRDVAVDPFVRCNTRDMEPHYHSSLQRFLREANALVKYRDIPEIVDIYDLLEENGTAYIVMEYVPGADLGTYVQRKGGRLTAKETFRILKPVMEALAEVHVAGCVHRDISPDNIMLHPTGGAKLLDFGAVRTVIDPQIGKELSHSTEAILKHGFAPIEQYHSRGAIGPWTDEYAMCATIWYCLTGNIPDNAPIRTAEGTDLDWSKIPGLDRGQQLALKKGSSVRAKDRFGDMEELMDALFQPGMSVGLPVRPSVEHKDLSRDPVSRNKKLPWPIFLAVGVVAVAILSVWLFLGRSKPVTEGPTIEDRQEYTVPVEPYLQEAEALAVVYDYDGAIAVLDSYPGKQPPEITARKAHYEVLKAKLVEWKDYSTIPDLSFHVLIADPARAFADGDLGGSYNRNFITVDEFRKILEQLYKGGYVLVDFDSFTGTDAGQEIFTVPIMLPEDKKPVMITETMGNYFSYMVDSDDDGEPDSGGAGFAYRMIVDENGDIKAQMVDANGQIQTGNYDLVPVLEDFIKAHPDFSYKGARATLAVCGYEGIFGYRTNTSYISSVSRAYYDEQVAGAKLLIEALRSKGYTIACYTYGNVAYGDKTVVQIKADLQEWTNQITPVLGSVDILVYARTSDIINYDGDKFDVLYNHGFRYFISHGSHPYTEVNDSYLWQSRLIVTGENLTWNAEMFNGLFDPQTVLLPERSQVPHG